MASITSASRAEKYKPGLLQGRGFLTLLLILALLWSLSAVSWTGDILHPGGLGSVAQFVKSAFAPELSPSFLGLTVKAMWTTLVYAVAGLCLALVIGLPLGVLGSGVLSSSKAGRVGSVAGVRLVLGVFRSVHELVWAWLFVVALGLSPMAAILALALPYGGILGRIYADILNDVPQDPLRALRASGASNLKVLLYGRLPMAMPDMLSYTFYRFECGIRAAATMGFVGIGGLGMQILLSLGDLRYNEVWTLLYALIVLIALIDGWSTWLRRSLTS